MEKKIFILVFLCCPALLFAQSFGTKINTGDYDDKAKAYAILSARYSKDAYRYAKYAFNASDAVYLRAYADTSIVLNEVSMQYADSAMWHAADSNMSGKERMLVAKDYNNEAMKYLFLSKTRNKAEMRYLAEEAMYASGNAIIDAYDASMHLIDRNTPPDKSTRKRPMYEKDTLDRPDMKKERESGERDVTRLESDEFTFVTLDHMFDTRLEEIDEEVYDLELKLADAVDDDEKLKLQEAIEELKEEKNMLEEKKAKSEKRLVFLKQDLGMEMAKAVNSEIFTTGKKGFYSDENPIPKGVDLPKGLVYKVQVGFFMNKIPPEHFEGIFPLSAQKVDDVYLRYMAGAFPTYKEANEAKRQVMDKGYTDAFVVAFYDDKKISIAEALSIENEEKSRSGNEKEE